MKILHVVQKLDRNWGGLSLFVAEIAREQTVLGHDVSILCDPEGENVSCCDYGKAQLIDRNHCDLEREILRASIRHIHGLWLPLYHRTAKICQRNKVPYVHSTHGMLEPAALTYSGWKKRFAWMLYQKRDLARAGLLHATADKESQTLSKLFTNRIVQAAPGIRLPENIHLHARINTSTKKALFIGRLHEIKGIDILVDAWIQLDPGGWELTIAGPDECNLRGSFEKRIREANIKSPIHWVGPVFGDDKNRLLEKSHLLLVPSRSENFAISVLEGLGYGLPVIATNTTPWACLSENGMGWICEPNVEDFAKALRRACKLSINELSRKGSAGRSWVETRFDWRHSARLLVESYGWLQQNV